ncbi:uncharacterized protein [Antedon mediterranea]|uniref:uncharacterized protein n=1 Tax=Antedon mediterranea TaxID=105859 RepID=UPI003AF4490E
MHSCMQNGVTRGFTNGVASGAHPFHYNSGSHEERHFGRQDTNDLVKVTVINITARESTEQGSPKSWSPRKISQNCEPSISKSVSFTISPEDSVRALKSQIINEARCVGWPDRCVLYFRGTHLCDDDMQLKKYGIANGEATLLMVSRLENKTRKPMHTNENNQIVIELANKISFKIDVDWASDIIEDIKNKVAIVLRASVNGFQLRYEETYMKNGEPITKYLTPRSLPTVRMITDDDIREAETGNLKVLIELESNGDLIPIESIHDTIAGLKHQIEIRTRLPRTCQRLIFEGNELTDDRSLRSYNLQRGNVILLKTEQLDFLNLDEETFLVNSSSKFKQTNIINKTPLCSSQLAPKRTSGHQPLGAVSKFNFKFKQSSPPTSDGRPKYNATTTTARTACSTTSDSLTTCNRTTSGSTTLKDLTDSTARQPTLPAKGILAPKDNLLETNQQKTPNKQACYSNMLASPSQQLQAPKSQRFSWNKPNNDIDKTLSNDNNTRQQPCQRSALQILQKNMGSHGNRSGLNIKTDQSKTIINQPNGKASSLRTSIQMNNNCNKEINGRNFQPLTNNINQSGVKDIAVKDLQMRNNYNNNLSYSAMSSKLTHGQADTCKSNTMLNHQYKTNSYHHHTESSMSVANKQRANFQQHSPYTPRPRTPCNRHTSPRVFQGAGTSRIARTPDPLFSAPQTPHFTPRVAELCRTPTSVRKVEKTRLRKFPGPAGILPKLISSNDENKFDVVLSETDENEEEKMDIPSSQFTPIVDDFTSGTWTTMLHVLDIDVEDPTSILTRNNIALVLRKASLKQLQQNKVAHLCVLLKTIQFNGTDASSILKDPTGEIQGTIHRKLMEDLKDELKPGCVLILRQVGVLSPSLRNHYLNITPSNLVHLFPAEVKGQNQRRAVLNENLSEPSTYSPRLKEFIIQLGHKRSNLVQSNTTRKTQFTKHKNTFVGRPTKTQHLMRSQEQSKRDSLTTTEHAPKTGNITVDDNVKRGSVGADKSPKRVCLESSTSVGNHGINSETNADLGENIDELLKGIEHELFEDF